MKLTREDNGNVQKEKKMPAMREEVPVALKPLVPGIMGGLTTRFSGCGDGVTFIACLDINERHVSLNLAHCPI